MKIYAPNADYTGKIAGVAFAAGVGELTKKDVGEEKYEHLKEWFGRRGYGIGSKKDAGDPKRLKNLKGTAKPLAEMSRTELEEVAAGKGILGAKDMKDEAEIVAAIESSGGANTED